MKKFHSNSINKSVAGSTTESVDIKEKKKDVEKPFRKTIRMKGRKGKKPKKGNQKGEVEKVKLREFKTRYCVNGAVSQFIEDQLGLSIINGNHDPGVLPRKKLMDEIMIARHKHLIGLNTFQCHHNVFIKPRLQDKFLLREYKRCYFNGDNKPAEPRNDPYIVDDPNKLLTKKRDYFSLHGIYHFDADDITELIGDEGSLVFIHYSFSEGSGKIFHELDYKVPDENAILMTNSSRYEVYRHFRWIMSTNAKKVKYNDEDRMLIWKTEDIGKTGYYKRTKFYLVDEIFEPDRYDKYFYSTGKERVYSEVLNKIKMPNTFIWYGNNVSLKTKDDEFIVVPEKVIAKTLHACTLVDTLEKKKDIIATCRRAIANDNTPGISKVGLSRVAPLLINACIEEASNNVNATAAFQHRDNINMRKLSGKILRDEYQHSSGWWWFGILLLVIGILFKYELAIFMIIVFVAKYWKNRRFKREGMTITENMESILTRWIKVLKTVGPMTFLTAFIGRAEARGIAGEVNFTACFVPAIRGGVWLWDYISRDSIINVTLVLVNIIVLFILLRMVWRHILYLLSQLPDLLKICSIALLLYFVVPVKSSYLEPVVNEQPLYSFTVLLILITILIAILKRVKKSKFDFWKQFKETMEYENRTIKGAGSVPFGDGPIEFTVVREIEDVIKEYGIREGCKVKQLRPEKFKKKRKGTFHVGVGFTHVYPRVFASNDKNTQVSVHTRVVQKLPTICLKYKRRGWKTFKLPPIELKVVNGVIRPNYTTFFANKLYQLKAELSFEGWLKKQKFPKAKADRIRKVRSQARILTQRNFVWEMFVKREKQLINSYNDFEFVKPRAVQGTSWFTKSIAGSWAINFSAAIKFILNPNRRYWYCSGYTPDMYHYWINDKIVKFNEPVFMVSDYSKYDVTQAEECIEYQIRWLKAAGFDNLPYSTEILNSYRKTKGYGGNLKYECGAMMHSGSLFTSVCNTLSTYTDRRTFNEKFRIHKSYSAMLGDDNFSIFEYGDIKRIFGTLSSFKNCIERHSAELGFQVKTLVTLNIVEAEFLSCKFFPTSDGYALSKKPGRVLSKIGMFLNKGMVRTKDEWLGVFKGTLQSYASTSKHVPFLRKYLEVMLGALSHVKTVAPEKSWNDFSGGKCHEANDDTWMAFTAAYDLDQADEIEFEKQLKDQIRKFGTTSIFHCTYVEHMYKLELVL